MNSQVEKIKWHHTYTHYISTSSTLHDVPHSRLPITSTGTSGNHSTLPGVALLPQEPWASTGGRSDPLAPTGARRERHFWSSLEGPTPISREAGGSYAASRGGRLTISTPGLCSAAEAVGQATCSSLCPLWLWEADPSRGSAAHWPPVSVSVSDPGLTCSCNLLLCGHDPLWPPGLFCIFPLHI